MDRTVVDTYTVACPFPDCPWSHTAEILDYYPPPMVDMFTIGADQARERHLGEHDGPAWAQAYLNVLGGRACRQHDADGYDRLVRVAKHVVKYGLDGSAGFAEEALRAAGEQVPERLSRTEAGR